MIDNTYDRRVVVTCFDPLLDTITFLLVQEGNSITTGCPYMMATKMYQDAYDLVYTSFELEPATNALVTDPPPVRRQEEFIVDFTLEEVLDIAEDLSSYTDALSITYYKHPDRDEYALPWCQYIVYRQIPEPPRVRYEAYVRQAGLDGRIKTRTEMLADGWA